MAVVALPHSLVTREINRRYEESVKPIFEQKCFNCHSNQTHFPWYYAIPGVKQFIDSDIEEAKSHFDFTNGYPFGGEHKPEQQPDEIAKSTTEGDMPPFYYRIMHRGSALTEKEKTIILQWVREAEKLLGE